MDVRRNWNIASLESKTKLNNVARVSPNCYDEAQKYAYKTTSIKSFIHLIFTCHGKKPEILIGMK